jgi:hypothetical protein
MNTFNDCLQLIVYAYFQLSKQKRYSRSEILKLTSEIRGKDAKQLELEDYLRNDLVDNFLMPNRELFDLEYFLFQPGAEENRNNVKTGILDIKVSSPILSGAIYYAFECKRFNNEIADEYITEGVFRFTNNQYYTKSEVKVGGMIAFLEARTPKIRINAADSPTIITELLEKHKALINTRSPITQVKLRCLDHKEVAQYEFVFLTEHERIDNKLINIFHLLLDYNELVVD